MLNQCNFIGRVGKEPESRFLANGDEVVSFSLAVSETWKDKSGEKQERTEWVNVVAWRKLAGIISAHVQKGALLFISGKYSTRKWEDKDGNTRYSTEIVCSEMKMLGGKGEGGNKGQGGGGQQNAQGTDTNYGYPDGFNPDQDIPF